jgi:hypothetical protein
VKREYGQGVERTGDTLLLQRVKRRHVLSLRSVCQLGQLLEDFARLEEARFRDVSIAFKDNVARFHLTAWFNRMSVQWVF